MYFYVQLPVFSQFTFLCDRVPDSESKALVLLICARKQPFGLRPVAVPEWPCGFLRSGPPSLSGALRITTPCEVLFLIQEQVTNQVLLYLLIWLHLEACGILSSHQGLNPRAHGSAVQSPNHWITKLNFKAH